MNSRQSFPAPVRVAIVGGGGHGLHTVAAAVAALPGWEISAIVDPLEDVRRSAAAQLPGAQIVAHHDALLETGALPDLVVLATPPAVTPEVLRALLPLPCALLVEKPCALQADALDALTEGARGRSHAVHCAYSYRQHHTVRAFARQLPDIGPLRTLSLSFCAPMQVSGWRASREAGGGALRDLGAHLIDLALQLVPGPWQVTSATLTSRRTDHDDCTVQLRAGATELIIRAAYHGAPVFRLDARGSQGALEADLWRMVKPATSPIGRLLSQGQTRLVPHLRPAALLRQAYADTLRAVLATGPNPHDTPISVATLHDAATVLRHIALAENAQP